MADPKYADLPGIVSLSKVSITCRIFVICEQIQTLGYTTSIAGVRST